MPTRKETAESQSAVSERCPKGFSKRKGVVQNKTGVFWVPSKDERLKLRLLIPAHTGVGGHRKKTQTKSTLQEHFYWDDMKRDTNLFCD